MSAMSDLLLALAFVLAQQPATLELSRGLWFDGRSFTPTTWYAVDGKLTHERPAQVDRVLDLEGGFVVPPFGEAHNHNVYDGAEATLARYLEQGIFYVKNPNSLPRQTTSVRALVNRPDGVDVVFSGGSITAPGGHPVELVENNVKRGTWTEADGEGAFYFTVRDRAELDAKWPAIVAQPRDFLKTFLLYSEEYERRRDDPASIGWRGLDPALLPEIVERAHEHGWRVSTHVETATDFHHAVAAGVDEINHMPGFRADQARDFAAYRIAEEDARRAAAGHVVVVTTLGGLLDALEAVSPEHPDRARADECLDMVLHNLEILQANRVTVALGSDEFEGSAQHEALALARLGVIDPATLLRMWCEDTPRAIFPGREIGRFEAGFEASLLVLAGDPLASFERVRDIRLRVKQGRVLER